MSIIGQAQLELERVNFGEGDTAVMLGILRTFFGQWDSGGGVSVASEVLSRLVAGQPLTPLTGEPDEWCDPIGDGHLLQNVRCRTVFRERDGKCYDIGAPGGHDVPVEFPYNPITRSVEIPIYEATVDDLLASGVDRADAEFVHGEQWSPRDVHNILSSEARKMGNAFDPSDDLYLHGMKDSDPLPRSDQEILAGGGFEPIACAAARVVKALTVGGGNGGKSER